LAGRFVFAVIVFSFWFYVRRNMPLGKKKRNTPPGAWHVSFVTGQPKPGAECVGRQYTHP
jgi:hypothetical protein